MKLWQKGKAAHDKVDQFTVGSEREYDLLLAAYDCEASSAHAQMLAKIQILTQEEADLLTLALNQLKEKEKKQLKEELETVQSLMKKAQKYFNTYIRERDKKKPCVSCGQPLGHKFDAGHYFSSGTHKAVTFDERNVHGQCVACNQHKHGNLLNYQTGIQERIGENGLIQLE